ncbi:MAG: SCP2 sterol-binding domain-containing protein [Saprospiraceae bacterium]|nr:SCP2 sterol-binding domain-containing protein [Saprospiraceae bacterium]
MSFESTLNAITSRAATATSLGSSLKFDFGDQQILLDGTGDSNVVSTENKDADCTVSIKLEDLEAMMKGDLNPMMAFMSGKIKVKGDMGVAMKLQSFLK